MSDSGPPTSPSIEPSQPADSGPGGSSFRGRLRRRGFWLWTLVLMVLAFLMLGAFAPAMSPTGSGGDWRVDVLLAALPFFAVYAWVVARRLKDINVSPWWTVAVGLLLVVVPIVMMADSINVYGRIDKTYEAQQAIVPYVLSLEIGAAALFLGGWLVLGLIRGTAGANRFGPDPIVRKASADQV